MPGLPVELRGRGVRCGLFAFLLLAAGCDKPAPDSAGTTVLGETDNSQTTADAGKADVEAEPAAPEPKADFAPPWHTLAPSWDVLEKELAGATAGTMSGEAWGQNAVVREVVRASCGGGTLLQAVFETDKGLRVGPAMPVRFFSLATDHPVTYREGNFEVTVNFSHDDAKRVAGTLGINYEEHGQDKTFINLEVDTQPLQMLLQPRLDGDSKLPEFHSCHPSGRFYVEASDGRTAAGFTYAGASPNGRSMVVTPLLTEQSGLRIIVYAEKELKEPWKADLSKDASGAPVRIAIEALNTPELIDPAEAQGPNIGTEQKVNVRRGTVELMWRDNGKTPQIEMTLRDLEIPELIEGPLRGTTLKEFRIEATAYPPNVYPVPPPPELLGPSAP